MEAIRAARPHYPLFDSIEGEILLVVDRIYRPSMREKRDSIGVTTIPCPDERLDAETNLMDPRFRTWRQADTHHATQNGVAWC
ncbi:MAG: hypothetical protein P1U55_06480 [Vannielia sp.]|nr:hypothetical protein [Vannielia sp.]